MLRSFTISSCSDDENHLLQVLVKPGTRLQKGVLFCIFLLRNIEVATHRKPVLHATIKIDLVWLLEFLQDGFSLVALLRREDGIGFCGRQDMSA